MIKFLGGIMFGVFVGAMAVELLGRTYGSTGPLREERLPEPDVVGPNLPAAEDAHA